MSQNEKPSSEINLSDIEKLAAEVDMINEAEGRKKKTRTSTRTNSEGKTVQVEEQPTTPPIITPDPEFQFMLTHIVMGTVEKMKEKLQWDDPGLQWKEKVGLTVFKLSQRIAPMGDSWMTDLATLIGYVGLWSASNVLFNERPSENTDSTGNDGKR